jgi:SAM-dependent methyltransferase
VRVRGGADLRAWASWRAKAKLLRPVGHIRPQMFPRQLLYGELRETVREGYPEIPPYDGLAAVWNDYHKQHPDYLPFLEYACRDRKVKPKSVLDLACGTGMLTERLAQVFPCIVALDQSEAMLAQARKRPLATANVRLAQADFRNFDMGQQFDAVVCASDSLNYVANTDELAQVFGCVARHLRSGGLFLFDTITRLGMQLLCGQFAHFSPSGLRLAIHFKYDERQGRETSVVMLPQGIEVHHRIPIDPLEVMNAIAGTPLAIEDYFSSSIIPGRWRVGPRCFFVLSRRD